MAGGVDEAGRVTGLLKVDKCCAQAVRFFGMEMPYGYEGEKPSCEGPSHGNRFVLLMRTAFTRACFVTGGVNTCC